MQDKELEKIIQEQADKTKMRDFSLVWEEIKDEITPVEKERKSIWKKKFFLIFAPAILVICIALSPFLIKYLTPAEEVFYDDELIKNTVTAEVALDELSSANLLLDSISGFALLDTYLYYTEDGVVKGAHFSFYDENPTTFFATTDLYDKNVELNQVMENSYENFCKVNSADVSYTFMGYNNGFYEYSVYATFNGVKYLIEYSGLTDNLTEFLTNFFA